jgi:hypothetical protein
MAEYTPHGERRQRHDRRKNPGSLKSICLLGGRRKQVRRAEDAQRGYYVDLYSKRSLMLIVGIFLLSVLDGYLTLGLVNKGATEANPIMRFYLQVNTPLFLIVKYGVSYLSVFLLLIHKNFYILRTSVSVKQVMLGILGIYAVLVLWQVVSLI